MKRHCHAALPFLALLTFALVGCDEPTERPYHSSGTLASAYTDPNLGTVGSLSANLVGTIPAPSPVSSGLIDYSLSAQPDNEGRPAQLTVQSGDYSGDIVSQIDNGDGTITATDENGRDYTVDADSIPPSTDDN